MSGTIFSHRKYVIEFIGTFFLVLTIGLSGGNALAIGGVLAAMVYMGGYVSGAHYNPAVTLAIYLQKKIKKNDAAVYMLVQLAAAIVAAIVYHIVHGGKFTVSPGAGVGFGAALLVEIIFTFALVSVVLHTAVSSKTTPNSYYGLAIGFVLTSAVFAGSAISGGAFNPAVGLGPNLYNIGSSAVSASDILLYLIGPILGGILASYVYGETSRS
jgi:aquaporin Z